MAPDKNATGSISGKITDENGDPVPNAVVIILNKQIGCMGDSVGRFTLRKVPVGTFTLRANSLRAGRSEKSGVQVEAGKVTAVDFVLTRSAGAGAPVFTGAYDPCDGSLEGDPDEQSLVRIGVRTERGPGTVTYIYKVLNRSLDTLTEVQIGLDRVRVAFGERLGPCEWLLTPPHMPPDTALSPPGWTCAPIQSEDSTRFALSWKVATSAGGLGIRPNSSSSGFTVTLRGRDPQYANCRWVAGHARPGGNYHTGRVRPGPEVDAISMARGTIFGKVADQSGTPVTNATVHIPYARLSTAGASDGSYTLSAVPVGEYGLMVYAPGYERCSKSHVRVTAAGTSRVDFHLSTGALSIPCSAYTTSRNQLGVPFPPADIEIVYRGLGQDTTSRAFVAAVHREFRDSAEERLLRIAEETYPPTKAVVSIADSRMDRKAMLQEGRLWWYGEFDGVRLPYAVTMDAVRYYLDLTRAFGRGDSSQTHGIRMKGSKFSYTARISPGPRTFSRGGHAFENVYVVEMSLEWGNYCGRLCACGFSLDRTVLVRRDGAVVCVFGDRKPMVVVS